MLVTILVGFVVVVILVGSVNRLAALDQRAFDEACAGDDEE